MLLAKKSIVLTTMVFIVVFILSACAGATPFRLHIMANSDSEADQQIKLIVRDAVLDATKDGIKKCDNAEQAEEYIIDNIGIILETANDTLEENGYAYTATASVGAYYFPETRYQEQSYPKGEYQALRIILGDGEGQNWWCVMFPPLCITEIETDEEDIEYTSFLAELFASIFGD